MGMEMAAMATATAETAEGSGQPGLWLLALESELALVQAQAL
jgi:hypothetical protein